MEFTEFKEFSHRPLALLAPRLVVDAGRGLMVALFNPPPTDPHSSTRYRNHATPPVAIAGGTNMTTAWDDPCEPESDRFGWELVWGLIGAIVVIGGIMAMLILLAVRQMRP